MNTAFPCYICQQQGHSSRKCPELHKDLGEGFMKPAGGRPQGGDDEEGRLSKSIQSAAAPSVPKKDFHIFFECLFQTRSVCVDF